MDFIYTIIKSFFIMALLVFVGAFFYASDFNAELDARPKVVVPFDNMAKCENVVPRPVEHTIWGDISTGSDCAD